MILKMRSGKDAIDRAVDPTPFEFGEINLLERGSFWQSHSESLPLHSKHLAILALLVPKMTKPSPKSDLA